MRSIVRLKRTAASEYAWLQQVSKCAPEAAIQDLHQALMTYLLRPKGSRLGFPRFKKKGVGRESVRLHGSIAIVAGSLVLELAAQAGEGLVGQAAAEATALQHPAHGKVLDHHRLLAPGQLAADLCQTTGCRLLVAPRYFPSSKRCSDCGWIWVGMPLSAREFVCAECGGRRDRDHNAALNLKWWAQQLLAAEVAAGRAETLNACGARVRPGLPAGAEQLPKAGRAQAAKQESSTTGSPMGQSRTTNPRGGS